MKQKAKELYESGFGSLKKIADELGVSYDTVKSWKSRDKVPWVQPNVEKVAPAPKKTATKKKEVQPEKQVSKKIEEIEISNSDLTEKQRLFCSYYIQSFNATQSAIKAGYSRDSAMEQGYQLLQKTSVKAEIERLKALMSQKFNITQEMIINKYMQIAFSDIKDFTEFSTYGTFVGMDDDGKPLTADGFNFKIKDDVEVDGTIIKKIGMGKFGPTIELEDRMKALEFLSKIVGLDKTIEIQQQKLEIEKEKLEIERLRANPNSKELDDMADDEIENEIDKLRGVIR